MYKKVFRVIFFFILLFSPIIWGWWLFVPFSLVLVIIANRVYEPILVGGLLDILYYFGPSFWQDHLLLIIGALFSVLATLLEKEVNWRKLL